MILKEVFLGKLEITEKERREVIRQNISDCQRQLRLSDERMKDFLEFLEADE